MNTEWHIHCRAPSEKKSMLLAANRYRTRLRVHALRYSEKSAKRALAVLRKDFPGFRFKMVKAQ